MAKSNTSKGVAHYVIVGAQGVLAALTVYFLVRAVVLFTTPQSIWTVGDTSSHIQSPSRPGVQAYSFNFDPFHRDAKPASIDEGSDAPETTLNLKMVGRRAGDGGSAIIVTPDRKQGVYRVGDEIISGVTLKTVTPDYIVLSQGGRLERLTFERSESTMTLAQPNTTNPTISRASTQQVSLNDLVAAVNLERVSEGGRIQGFRIVPRRSSANLSAFGLQPGDVITKIANQDLTSGRPNLPQLFAELSQRKSANITLIRNGQTLNVKVGQ